MTATETGTTISASEGLLSRSFSSGDFFGANPFNGQAAREVITIEDLSDFSVVFPVASSVPLSLRISNIILFGGATIFLALFIFSLAGTVVIHPSISLLASVALYGLYNVFSRVEGIIKRKAN